MSARTALVILTFVDRDRPPGVRHRLRDALASLERTSYKGPVIVVDDGSSCGEHLGDLDRLARGGRYEVIRRPVNGGPSRAKNTCLRVLAERDVDVGFLAEDDVVFHDGWDAAYVSAMERSNIHHMSWYEHDPRDPVVACNGGLVTATGGLLGLLLTMTPEVLRRVGGFKVLPRRYGYEHIQWTYRAVLAGLAPFPCDVVGSHRYIGRSPFPSSFGPEEMQAGIEQNRAAGHAVDRIYEPLEE
jgi:GT2 family glycosyltransferase